MFAVPRRSMEAYFADQDKDLRQFYERMSQETDHLKSVLGVKMHVQLESSGIGFIDGTSTAVIVIICRQWHTD